MKLLLDTNAYSRLAIGDEAVLRRTHSSEALFLSAVVVGELLQGFRGGTQWNRNLAQLHHFLELPHVSLLPVTFETANRYSLIMNTLRRKGRPIPSNDIWIAAHAMETGAYLVSFDGHFDEVDGLAWLHLGQGG